MFRAFVASSPEVEVDGRTVVAVTGGILVGAVARELLASCGLERVEPEGWYQQQAWLDVYRAIHEHLGADTLYSIGRRIPYSAEFPDEQMFDVPSALAAIDIAYHNAHRGGEIGVYRFVEVGMDHYQVQCDNPYPNVFDLGIAESLVERFHGRMQFKVELHQAQGDDNACVIDIVRV
ncbi:MAG: hypothetical protein KF696_04230 [Planctomycetes bacterium]|nr:hypothetical protein [Planctomycetota bacterium]MCW8134180.1 hypothetical protein [Planctomycetota bacterium]